MVFHYSYFPCRLGRVYADSRGCLLLDGLNVMGETNPDLDLTPEQQEIVEALQISKDSFTTIKSGYRDEVHVEPS